MWGKLAFSIGLVSMGIVIGSLTNLVNLNGSEESNLSETNMQQDNRIQNPGEMKPEQFEEYSPIPEEMRPEQWGEYDLNQKMIPEQWDEYSSNQREMSPEQRGNDAPNQDGTISGAASPN
ncbi:hypothetical protein [Lysinibacillus parviboronicapiens]|uniref:Uncharacterized protein n=1 Tax=Lysinibacillus parviboronicapiens TaxID=436516 RepID=A0ABV2PKJ9_9BACI|nr:hypothetical protein [Lysinibacillus parviboronicapiens]